MGPPPEPDGPGLSFLRGRERWRATKVEATVRDVRRDGEQTTTELTLTIVARDGATGEQVTLLMIAPELSGTHPIRVFGSFASFDTNRGYERLQGITNACSPNDRSLTTGTLTIEEHDPAARILRGTFIANVCLVGKSDETWTLGDGKFQELSY
ncbi:MAG: hypothetical protein AAGE94_14970 [Acidobacteriota bacterium]